MGLNLGGKPVAKTKGKKENARKPKATKTKSKQVQTSVAEDDEIITADNPEAIEEEQTAASVVKPVKAFEGGLVHPSLNGAVNAYWRKSPESELFISVLTMVRMYEGTYFGSIYVKSSFLRKTGGSALL